MSGLTRNPLGILAIFLGVLYGIAGLLLGTSNNSISDANQTLLTWLVVLFPFVSLGTFGWLVAKHHTKLYSPTDFRTDEGFFDSLKSASTKEAEKKLEIEEKALEEELIAIEAKPDGINFAGAGPEIDSSVAVQSAIKSTPESRKNTIRMAEDGIFRILQDKFDFIKRNVRIKTASSRLIIIDGLGWNRSSEASHFIETFYFSRSSTLRNRSRDIAFQMNRISHSFTDGYEHRLLACLAIASFDQLDKNGVVKCVTDACRDLEMLNVDVLVFTASPESEISEI